MTVPAFPDLHEQTYRELDQWIERLRQVDSLLENSVTTLVDVAEWWRKSGRSSVPLFIADTETAPERLYLLVHAIYTSTIQRLAGVRRRFDWLSKEQSATLDLLSREMPRVLQAPPGADRRNLSFLKHAASDLFGALNPLTSAEIFWAFIRGGETYAHSGVGFLAFFGMLWSLNRRYPDAIETGASLEPSGPSTTVTAKCLIAIRALCDALRQRGRLFRRAAKLVATIDGLTGDRRPQAAWRFASELDLLAGTLFELSAYTLTRDDFVDAGEHLLAQSRALRADSDTKDTWKASRERIGALLRELDRTQRDVFRDAADVVEGLFPQIVERLAPNGAHHELRQYCHKLAMSKPDEYWLDHARAAEEARQLCARALAKLQEPFGAFDSLRSAVPAAGVLDEHLRALAESNFGVATEIENAIAPSVQWCQRAIDAESALSSAGYVTDFDAAGLISAVSVAQKWNNISRLQTEDAIRHVLTAALQDGSWRRGQPIFLQDRVLGIWPHTPDIVWVLAVAVNAQPEITIADDKIFAFVTWLERTEMRFEWRDGATTVRGWSSELDRQPRIIDFWNTAVSINALLEIRELIEYRLWRLCCRRFTILRTHRRLSEVAPVDLGARHENRLHRRLRRMARLTEMPDRYTDQLYALVLHGPPGSSKTALVEGLGSEMWKEAARDYARIIRITPADFTQQGEARLDHEARRIFELITHVRGVTILFDEIDDFLRQRVLGEEIHFIKLVIPAMLNRLQDLRDAAPRQQICYILATNFVDKIEPALLRPGRIDAIIPVSYPDAWSREAILDANAGGHLTPSLVQYVLDQTVAWPWSTFNKMARELAKKTERITEATLREHLDGFIDQVQNPQHYYFDVARWKKPSPPLANEFVHLAFCTSKDIDRCRQTVSDLVNWLEENGVKSAAHRLFDTFDRQVEIGGRRS